MPCNSFRAAVGFLLILLVYMIGGAEPMCFPPGEMRCFPRLEFRDSLSGTLNFEVDAGGLSSHQC